MLDVDGKTNGIKLNSVFFFCFNDIKFLLINFILLAKCKEERLY